MTARQRRRSAWQALSLALALLGAGAGLSPASAQIGSDRYASIVVDARTGAVLEEANADAPRHPASLAKLMTLYLTFEALRDRRVRLDSLVPVSEYAASMEPTKLGLTPETRITVEQAIMGLVTRSANDAAAALGEMLGGNEARFAQLMTLRARALGMAHSTFTNASGLPDPDAWTTARDLALLARRLIYDFPGYYHYFGTPRFVFRGQVIFNHDNLLTSFPGADGLKTGYTVASGHNLVSSAVRGATRLVGVTLGCASNGERDAHMAALLTAGFAQEGVPVSPPPIVTARASRYSLIGSARAAEPDRRFEPRLHPVVQLRPAGVLRFGVQLGSFPSEHAARAAAEMARQASESGAIHLQRVRLHGRKAWRAQLIGLSSSEAALACSAAAKRGAPCAVIHPQSRQMAAL
ncbi:MAG TPA: D-alanyl-D-alanine carboxypeptidase family protein [Acetobacteraceae bacterium]|nr:D-alanyl-D-alanine carboxypeptidase family protein [Acetobacteraceae bacterium]